MGQEFEAWVKGDDGVYRATSDDTSREFYENSFLVQDFSRSFSENLRLIDLSVDDFFITRSGDPATIQKYKYSDPSEHSAQYSSSSSSVGGACIDDKGNIYIGLDNNAVKLNSDLGEELVVTYGDTDDAVHDVKVDKSKNIYVALERNMSGDPTGSISKLDPEGNELWQESRTVPVYELSVSPSGNRVGYLEGSTYFSFGLLNSSDGSNISIDLSYYPTYYRTIEFDANDNLYVYGIAPY